MAVCGGSSNCGIKLAGHCGGRYRCSKGQLALLSDGELGLEGRSSTGASCDWSRNNRATVAKWCNHRFDNNSQCVFTVTVVPRPQITTNSFDSGYAIEILLPGKLLNSKPVQDPLCISSISCTTYSKQADTPQNLITSRLGRAMGGAELHCRRPPTQQQKTPRSAIRNFLKLLPSFIVTSIIHKT